MFEHVLEQLQTQSPSVDFVVGTGVGVFTGDGLGVLVKLGLGVGLGLTACSTLVSVFGTDSSFTSSTTVEIEGDGLLVLVELAESLLVVPLPITKASNKRLPINIFLYIGEIIDLLTNAFVIFGICISARTVMKIILNLNHGIMI